MEMRRLTSDTTALRGAQPTSDQPQGDGRQTCSWMRPARRCWTSRRASKSPTDGRGRVRAETFMAVGAVTRRGWRAKSRRSWTPVAPPASFKESTRRSKMLRHENHQANHDCHAEAGGAWAG